MAVTPNWISPVLKAKGAKFDSLLVGRFADGAIALQFPNRYCECHDCYFVVKSIEGNVDEKALGIYDVAYVKTIGLPSMANVEDSRYETRGS